MRRLAGFLLTVSVCAPAAARSIDPRPKLTAVDWSQIRAEHERHRHSAFPDGSGFRARNREQQWNARFDGRGFEIEPDRGNWRFGLELLGHGKALVTVGKNRVAYAWELGVEEWFVNEARGIEHGFTIHRKSGPIELHLAIRGGLRAEGGATGVRLLDTSGAAAVTYSGLRAWDADHRSLAARLEVHGAELHLLVDDRGARYPVTIDPLIQQAYLKPGAVGTTQASDGFGVSVAVSGDTVVVGANLEDSASLGVNSVPNEGASNSGAAYVFVRVAGVWSQQAYLKPASAGTTQTADQFGISVAVSGDTVIVGASAEDSSSLGINGAANESAIDSGAVYVFVRVAGMWSQQAYLKPAGAGATQAADQFGISVAASGDTVIAGASGEDSSSLGVNSTPNESASGAGAAYVFVRTAGTWSQQAYLKPASAGATQLGDFFGVSVAVSGDTAVVGANFEDSGSLGVNSSADESAGNAGAAYVFVRTAGVWSQQAYLKPANVGSTQAADNFGISVAVSGDTAVVGANLEDSASLGVNGAANESATDAGAAYVFARAAGVWSQQAYLKPASVGTTQVNDRFGTSIAVSGDTVAVGANFEDSSSLGVDSNANEGVASAGAAYVFARTGGMWSQQAYLKPAAAGTTQLSDNFGRSVAASGRRVVVGASDEDSSSLGIDSAANESADSAGAAYAFIRLPVISEVTDAGSFRPEISAGAWVTIKGTDLSSTTRIWLDADFTGGRLPPVLDGVNVTIDGKPAAVYYISPGQLNVLAGALTRTGPVPVVVTTFEGTATFTATVRERVPAWFMIDPDNRKYVAAVNLDGTIVGRTGLYPSAPNATRPVAARGGRALIFGTGWGPTNPVTPEGTVFSGAFPLTGTVSIRIGGVAVVVEFAGVVTPGLYQFNIVAPDLPAGDYLIEGTINGQPTQAGAYITLGPPL